MNSFNNNLLLECTCLSIIFLLNTGVMTRVVNTLSIRIRIKNKRIKHLFKRMPLVFCLNGNPVKSCRCSANSQCSWLGVILVKYN